MLYEIHYVWFQIHWVPHKKILKPWSSYINPLWHTHQYACCWCPGSLDLLLTLAANALAPCIIRSSAAMFHWWDLVCHVEWVKIHIQIFFRTVQYVKISVRMNYVMASAKQITWHVATSIELNVEKHLWLLAKTLAVLLCLLFWNANPTIYDLE